MPVFSSSGANGPRRALIHIPSAGHWIAFLSAANDALADRKTWEWWWWEMYNFDSYPPQSW